VIEPRPRTRRDEQRERTRGELLDAAAETFAKHGFHGASVDLVADVAGYTKGAVYSNFRSKEELFLELLDRQLDATVDILSSVVDDVPPDQRAEAIAVRAAELEVLDGDWFLLEAEFLLYAARNEDPAIRERVAARQRQTRARITGLVQRHLDEVGADPAIVAEDLARLLIATADGLTQAAVVDNTARDGGRIFALLTGVLLRMLDETAPPVSPPA
jgi:AcrR family transcriptional regulator